MAKKATTAYDGRCRDLTDEEVRRKKEAGQSYVVRFKVRWFTQFLFSALWNSIQRSEANSSPGNTRADNT